MTTATSYADAYGDWMRDPSAYWEAEAEGITWNKRWDKVFDPEMGAFGQWFAGAHAEHVLQLSGPACRDRPRRPGRPDP